MISVGNPIDRVIDSTKYNKKSYKIFRHNFRQRVTDMANHKSAEKRIRQTATRTAVNRVRTSRIRASLRKVETAIASGDKSAAQHALREAQPELMSGVSKGVVKLGTASRKMSRLSARIKKLAA